METYYTCRHDWIFLLFSCHHNRFQKIIFTTSTPISFHRPPGPLIPLPFFVSPSHLSSLPRIPANFPALFDVVFRHANLPSHASKLNPCVPCVQKNPYSYCLTGQPSRNTDSKRGGGAGRRVECVRKGVGEVGTEKRWCNILKTERGRRGDDSSRI